MLFKGDITNLDVYTNKNVPTSLSPLDPCLDPNLPFNTAPNATEVVINDRWGKDSRHKHGGYWTTEYTPGMSGMEHPWEESRGMGFSYGYNRAERLEHYRTGRELVIVLSDIVSRGGNLLLDIGPDADGIVLGEFLRAGIVPAVELAALGSACWWRNHAAHGAGAGCGGRWCRAK